MDLNPEQKAALQEMALALVTEALSNQLRDAMADAAQATAMRAAAALQEDYETRRARAERFAVRYAENVFVPADATVYSIALKAATDGYMEGVEDAAKRLAGAKVDAEV